MISEKEARQMRHDIAAAGLDFRSIYQQVGIDIETHTLPWQMARVKELIAAAEPTTEGVGGEREEKSGADALRRIAEKKPGLAVEESRGPTVWREFADELQDMARAALGHPETNAPAIHTHAPHVPCYPACEAYESPEHPATEGAREGERPETWMVDYEHGESEPQHAVLSWLDDEAKDLPEVGTQLVRKSDYDALKDGPASYEGVTRMLREVQVERDELRLRARKAEEALTARATEGAREPEVCLVCLKPREHSLHRGDWGHAFLAKGARERERGLTELREGMRTLGFILGRNPDGVDDTVAGTLLAVKEMKNALAARAPEQLLGDSLASKAIAQILDLRDTEWAADPNDMDQRVVAGIYAQKLLAIFRIAEAVPPEQLLDEAREPSDAMVKAGMEAENAYDADCEERRRDRSQALYGHTGAAVQSCMPVQEDSVRAVLRAALAAASPNPMDGEER